MKIIKATATNMKYRHGKFTSGKSIKQNNISTLYVATVVSDAVLTFYKQKQKTTTTTTECHHHYALCIA